MGRSHRSGLTETGSTWTPAAGGVRGRRSWCIVPKTLGFICGVVLLTACAGGDDRGAGSPLLDKSASTMEEVEPQRGGVPLPPPASLPATDLSRHIVPLADVHFDTFDGRSIPLSEATSTEIEALRDRIPPIEQPVYVAAADIDILADEDLILGYVTDSGQAYAYPVKILNFHEIVNERLEGVPLVVTYCPLCRSGVVYDRRLDGRELTFGNTSALYDNDMVMYDHQTNSYWWHVAGRAIVGELSRGELEPLASSMSTWSDWVARHPKTWVLSTDTGYSRPYDREPFAGYRESVNAGRRPFPDAEASRTDDRLDDGEEIVGVVLAGQARAYPLRMLGDSAVNDELAGLPLVVFTRSEGPTGTVFERRLDGEELTFVLEGGRYRDEQTNSIWNIDGRAVEGPLTGSRLEPVPSRSSFWFAFAASFPDTDVFSRP